MDGASSFYPTAAAAETLSFEDEPSAASVDAFVSSSEASPANYQTNVVRKTTTCKRLH